MCAQLSSSTFCLWVFHFWLMSLSGSCLSIKFIFKWFTFQMFHDQLLPFSAVSFHFTNRECSHLHLNYCFYLVMLFLFLFLLMTNFFPNSPAWKSYLACDTWNSTCILALFFFVCDFLWLFFSRLIHMTVLTGAGLVECHDESSWLLCTCVC